MPLLLLLSCSAPSTTSEEGLSVSSVGLRLHGAPSMAVGQRCATWSTRAGEYLVVTALAQATPSDVPGDL